MSFRGAKRRGNPLNRNENTVAVATDLACFRNHYRAENLRYQFKHGQKLPPQFRQIICLVKVGRDTRTRCITVAEDFCLFEAYLYTQCAYSKTELESQGDDRSLEHHCGQGNRPMSFRGVKRRGNPLNRNKNRLTIATTALALAPTTAQRICAISSSKDKNSCHSCAKLSAW